MHIKDEIDFVLSAMADKKQADLENDPLLQRAVTRSLEVIGEAAKHVDLSFRKNYPQIDWKAMAGTRDKLIHDYMDVDYDIVYDIIRNELPGFAAGIKKNTR